MTTPLPSPVTYGTVKCNVGKLIGDITGDPTPDIELINGKIRITPSVSTITVLGGSSNNYVLSTPPQSSHRRSGDDRYQRSNRRLSRVRPEANDLVGYHGHSYRFRGHDRRCGRYLHVCGYLVCCDCWDVRGQDRDHQHDSFGTGSDQGHSVVRPVLIILSNHKKPMRRPCSRKEHGYTLL